MEKHRREKNKLVVMTIVKEEDKYKGHKSIIDSVNDNIRHDIYLYIPYIYIYIYILLPDNCIFDTVFITGYVFVSRL